jgi:YD repeat-containing protein
MTFIITQSLLDVAKNGSDVYFVRIMLLNKYSQGVDAVHPWLRKVFRHIASLLTLSLALQILTPGLSGVVLAAGPDKPLSVKQKDHFPARPGAGAKTEIKQRRGRNVRHFLNEDGSFTAEVFRDTIFFEDPKTHVMTPIDNALKPAPQSGFAFANSANRFATLFASKADAGVLTRFELDDSTLEFKASGVSGAQGVAKGNTITYRSAYPGVDLKYEVLSGELKESMILASANAPTTYTFALTVKDLTYQPQDDGSIAFYQPGKTEPAFLMPKPFMYEAGDEPLASQQVTQTIRQDGAQLYLDIIADAAWLKEPGRKFPVVLDPSIVVQPNAATSKDTFAASAYPTTSHYNLTYLIAGNHPTYGTNRSYVWFKLPALPDGAKIDSAKFSFYMYYNFTDTTTVELRRVTSDWESTTLTWNNQPSFGGTAESSTAMTGPAWYDLWATGLVADWYNAAQRNYGIMLQASPESANGRSFNSGDYTTDPTLTPKITINYTVDPVGDQSFWTYVGGVNPFNGNLLAKATDIATPGRGVPVTASRAYNSRAITQAGLFGYGWSSNLDMHITHTGWAPPLFWDASGTRHIFQDNGDGTFSPPPGISYGMKWDSPTSTYRITTLNNTVYTFDSSGRLTKITDPNNQITTHNRDASGKLTSITDPSGRQTTVAYNASGFVSSITDPAARAANYLYDASGNLTSVEIRQGTSTITTQYQYAAGTNRLTVIKDPKNQPTTITYDTANNRVSRIDWTADATSYSSYAYGVNGGNQKTGTVSGPLSRSTTYTFNDNGNLVKSEVSNGGSTLTTTYTWDTSNHLLTATDPNNHTTSAGYNPNGQPVMVTDAANRSATLNYNQGNNLVAAKGADGEVSAGAFDSKNNRTEQIDELGNATLMAYDSANGNLLSSTKPISLAENLLTNPGFEDALTGSWDAPTGVSVDTSTKTGGYQSLKIVSSTSSGLASRSTNYAKVTPGGYYTLTTDILTGSGAQAALRIYWYDQNQVLLGNTGNLSLTTNNLSWRRKGTHVDAPSNASYAKVELAVTGIGTVWFDNVQFETGAGRWGNNLLVSPSFDYDQDQTGLADFWYPPSPNPGGISIDFSTAKTGPASEKLVGQAGTDVYVGEQVDISGDSSTKLEFSGWAKSSGGTAGRGSFAMEIYLKNGTTTTEIFRVYFDPANSNWHQRSAVVKATQTFTSIKVYADYYGQMAGKNPGSPRQRLAGRA